MLPLPSLMRLHMLVLVPVLVVVEDPLLQLRDAIGADHMLFGSDFPHGEGLAEPVAFIDDIAGFSAEDTRLVMRENGLSLVRPL